MSTEEKTLQYTFSDLISLKRAFMPFVVEGGIFIPTQNVYQLGDLIKVTLTLPESKYDYAFTGEVIWITPKTNNHPGVGITCNGDEGRAFKQAVKEAISEFKGDDKELSDTM